MSALKSISSLLVFCAMVYAVGLVCSGVFGVEEAYSAPNTVEGKKTSDYLPEATYELMGTPNNIQSIVRKKISAEVSYVENSIMLFRNIQHNVISKYKYNVIEKTYINVDNPKKYLVYNEEKKELVVTNDDERAEYEIVFMEKKSQESEISETLEQNNIPVSYSDTINIPSLPNINNSASLTNTTETSGSSTAALLNPFMNNYYIGYPEKDQWLLALSKEDEELLKRAFPIQRTEQLTTRKTNIPVQETYHFSLLSGLELFMKSIKNEERIRLINHMKKLRIIVENRSIFEKTNIFDMLLSEIKTI